MKIKKIEVCGFKSFSEKIEIGFPSGVTAIVGPNGCGKSNVVDAIRWALENKAPNNSGEKQWKMLYLTGAKAKNHWVWPK